MCMLLALRKEVVEVECIYVRGHFASHMQVLSGAFAEMHPIHSAMMRNVTTSDL